MCDDAQGIYDETRPTFRELLHGYSDALQNYLAEPGDPTLRRAGKLGRRALDDGLGLLEMAAIHHESMKLVLLRALTNGDRAAGVSSEVHAQRLGALLGILRALSPEESTAAVKAAESFFGQSLLPFELSHRQFQDSSAALLRQNNRFEELAKRISHSLFDETLQLVAAIHLTLAQIARKLAPSDQGPIEEVQTYLEQIENQLAGYSHELRPAVLDHMGLGAAVESLAGGFSTLSGLEIDVDTTKLGALSPAVASILYRAVQEALSNVVRHAKAARVKICLQRDAGAISCFVQDDGIGFDAEQVFYARKAEGLGLVSIRESVRPHGGTLSVSSSPGNGTELRITVWDQN
jgi:signal transduction histidine kinase